jgi:hypothetical protein
LSIFLPASISFVAGVVEGLLSPVLFLQRNIGGFIADVTIEEDHTDEVVITDHPVERGASTTDHAFKRPSTVAIKAGWSNSSGTALGNPFYVQLVYNAMLALQASLVPFSITTGKRIYDNMLIRRLSVITDEKTEYALSATFECQEILIANTQTVSSTSGDPTNMQDPVNNAATVNSGSKSVVERSELPVIKTPLLF